MAAASNGGESGGVKEQLRSVDSNIARHQKNIDELYQKYEGSGRTNWQVLLSALAVLAAIIGGLWGLSIGPITGELKDINKLASKHAEELSEHKSEIAVLKTEVDRLKDTQRVFRELMRRVEDERLPTREFTIHQTANASDRVGVQRQIDALNLKIDAVFPPAKVLDDLVRRLSELERSRATLATSAAGKPP